MHSSCLLSLFYFLCFLLLLFCTLDWWIDSDACGHWSSSLSLLLCGNGQNLDLELCTIYKAMTLLPWHRYNFLIKHHSYFLSSFLLLHAPKNKWHNIPCCLCHQLYHTNRKHGQKPLVRVCECVCTKQRTSPHSLGHTQSHYVMRVETKRGERKRDLSFSHPSCRVHG